MIPYGGTYTVEGARRITHELVTVNVVLDTLQRLHVTVPYARSSASDLTIAIGAALAGINRPPKPLSPYLKAG